MGWGGKKRKGRKERKQTGKERRGEGGNPPFRHKNCEQAGEAETFNTGLVFIDRVSREGDKSNRRLTQIYAE